MADPTERYNKLVEEENKRLQRLTRESSALIPRYSPKHEKLSHEEEKQDYLTTKGTPEGLRMRLREGKEQFGLVQATGDFVDWVIRNENA